MGSVQRDTRVMPDLSCFGKALANGFPLAALVGSRLLVDLIPNAFYCPTFKGELTSLAAANACLKYFANNSVCDYVCCHGQRLKRAVNELCEENGHPARIEGPPYRSRTTSLEQDRRRRLAMKAMLNQEILRDGVLTYHGVLVPQLRA